jgi:hypothetical protein
VRCRALPPSRRFLSSRRYYLYGRSLKRANIMFSYMISKGVVEIVVAATLLDKVSVAHQSDRTASKRIETHRNT